MKLLRELAIFITIVIFGLVNAFMVAWATQTFTPAGQIAFLSPIAGLCILLLILKPKLTPVALMGLWATIPVPLFFRVHTSALLIAVLGFVVGILTMDRIIRWFKRRYYLDR